MLRRDCGHVYSMLLFVYKEEGAQRSLESNTSVDIRSLPPKRLEFHLLVICSPEIIQFMTYKSLEMYTKCPGKHKGIQEMEMCGGRNRERYLY